MRVVVQREPWMPLWVWERLVARHRRPWRPSGLSPVCWEALGVLWRQVDVEEVLRALTPREEEVVRRYWGIGVPRLTLEEIGARQAVTRTRVGEILQQASRRIVCWAATGEWFPLARGRRWGRVA